MQRIKQIFISASVTFFIALVLIFFSCKKNDDGISRALLESYINNTGHNMEITRYMSTLPSKSFTIKNNDTLIIESIESKGADTTGTILYADSAKVIFEDGKSYMMRDTTQTATNFLNSKNFKSSISPSGQTHYLRYTFSASDYALAE